MVQRNPKHRKIAVVMDFAAMRLTRSAIHKWPRSAINKWTRSSANRRRPECLTRRRPVCLQPPSANGIPPPMLQHIPASTRRDLLKWTLATAAVAGARDQTQAATASTASAEPLTDTLRDRLWIWTHAEGAYKTDYGLTRTSRMSPVEGAVYLGVHNLLFVRYSGNPPLPLDQYAISFRPMKRVIWSLVGAGGESEEAERRHVLDLATRFPNISAFIMDDFFRPDGTGSLSVDQLIAMRNQLVIGGRRRDLLVVLYQHQLALPVQAHLDFCDKITFWTWKAEELKSLESSFGQLEKLAPRQGKLLGCYLWDFGTHQPMPLDFMKRQCELGKQWLEQGRIEGMIFLASNVCDLELETVEWTRQWIAEVAGQRIRT